jgi:hypothetical protein
MKRTILHSTATGLALLLLAFSAAPAPALVDDAHSEALALATTAIKKGFKVREDFWKGTAKPGESKSVKAQLFKGNEYWFWLGSDEDLVDYALDLFDGTGQKISLETVHGAGGVGVRIVPPKTGTYVATFTMTLKPDAAPKAEEKPVPEETKISKDPKTGKVIEIKKAKDPVEKPAKVWWALAYGWR